MAAGPIGPPNPSFLLANTYGLIPLEDLRTERTFITESTSSELLASFEIPTNVLVKFDWTQS